MPIYGDGRSGTISELPGIYGGAVQGVDPPDALHPVNAPSIVSQPDSAVTASPPAYTGGGTINDGSTATTASLPVVIPATASVGNVAVVHIHGNFVLPGDDVTPPAGWTSITGATASGAASDNAGLVFGKTLASGEPGSTVTFTATTARRISGTITTYSNVDLSGVQFAALPDSTAGTTADLPTLASVPAGSMVVALFGRRSAVAATVTSMTVPAAYTAGPESRTAFTTAGNVLSRAARLVAGTAGTYGGETTATTSPDTTTGVDFLLMLPASVAGSTGATATGSITLGGSVTAQVAATAAGSVSLGGTPTATASAVVSGGISLAGNATGTAPATATGAITLGGTTTAQAPTTAAGTVTLGGAPTARAAATATGSVVLGGTATAGTSAPVAATALGGISLGGSVTARAQATAAGSLTLGGTVTATVRVTAVGPITLGGTTTPRVAATAGGAVSLNGLANAQAAATDYTPHTYVTAVLADLSVAAVLASNGTSTAAVAAVAPLTAALVAPPYVATLAGNGTSTAALATDGTSTATLADRAALAALQTTT